MMNKQIHASQREDRTHVMHFVHLPDVREPEHQQESERHTAQTQSCRMQPHRPSQMNVSCVHSAARLVVVVVAAVVVVVVVVVVVRQRLCTVCFLGVIPHCCSCLVCS
jgi:hypothetical protein